MGLKSCLKTFRRKNYNNNVKNTNFIPQLEKQTQNIYETLQHCLHWQKKSEITCTQDKKTCWIKTLALFWTKPQRCLFTLEYYNTGARCSTKYSRLLFVKKFLLEKSPTWSIHTWLTTQITRGHRIKIIPVKIGFLVCLILLCKICKLSRFTTSVSSETHKPCITLNNMVWCITHP